MKAASLLMIFLIYLGYSCQAQEVKSFFNSEGYLYIIKLPNGKTVQTLNLLIDIHDVDSSISISRVDAIRSHGVFTRSGAFVLKLNRSTQLLIFQQILDLFNIPEDDRNLPVHIDNQFVQRPETILAEKKIVSYVSINTDASTKERFIDIRSKAYREQVDNKVPNQVYIKLTPIEISEINAFLNKF